jgi:hypothetical protein
MSMSAQVRVDTSCIRNPSAGTRDTWKVSFYGWYKFQRKPKVRQTRRPRRQSHGCWATPLFQRNRASVVAERHQPTITRRLILAWVLGKLSPFQKNCVMTERSRFPTVLGLRYFWNILLICLVRIIDSALSVPSPRSRKYSRRR